MGEIIDDVHIHMFCVKLLGLLHYYGHSSVLGICM